MASARASSIWPLARANATAKHSKTVNCAVKALVLATPISGPARVGKTASASRAIVLLGTLTSPMVCSPQAAAWRMAISVSRLSPDCEIAIAVLYGAVAGWR